MRNNINGVRTILIIDDDRDIRETASHFLKEEGYNVATAVNGKTALGILRLLENYGLSLVLLDITLPQIDSFYILNLIRQRSSIPIIMLTEDYELSLLHKASALGADSYIRKPINRLELVASVEMIQRSDERIFETQHSKDLAMVPVMAAA